MIMQHILMYGLNLSPTLAAFQKTETTGLQTRSVSNSYRAYMFAYPSLFRSIHPGNIWWKYALVQMRRSRQRRADVKLKSADCS